MPTTPSRKRFLVAISLGFVFGILCVWLASAEDPAICSLKSFTFWTIVWNRILIGLMIAFAGAFVRSPIFGFRIFPFLRGTVIGAVVSLVNAFGILTMPTENAAMVFWLTVVAGAIYGLIIDVVATKVGGEGKALIN